MDRTRLVALALGIAGIAGFAGSAHADAIDGTWCAVDGRIMEIHGPAITTPGGTDTIGDYHRHSFSYTVPAGEIPEGATVRLVLMSEDIVNSKVGDGSGEAEVWQRCDTTS